MQNFITSVLNYFFSSQKLLQLPLPYICSVSGNVGKLVQGICFGPSKCEIPWKQRLPSPSKHTVS